MRVLLTLAALLACGALPAGGKLQPFPHTFAPALEGSTVANLSAAGCSAGWGASKAAMDRCRLLRTCCYAKLAARRCDVARAQQAVARAGIAACRSRSWCERGACRCERVAGLCRVRGRALVRPRAFRRGKCQTRVGRR
ncbi:basic phospholipase A2 Cdr-12-like [Apteryx rowi]|uniref:basic phospholipase A2 Cdr-12-like n=1 Tax=Apteryx rowi TaxID=308060 RepID=UPI000E1DF394|nr:basic phospholipase A2 Cdr-12-like [Apteryx rowi]